MADAVLTVIAVLTAVAALADKEAAIAGAGPALPASTWVLTDAAAGRIDDVNHAFVKANARVASLFKEAMRLGCNLGLMVLFEILRMNDLRTRLFGAQKTA